MSYSYTTFSKITNIGNSTVGPLLRDNIIEFFDWAFLEAGGYTNVTNSVHAGSGIYGDYRAALRLVNDPNFNNIPSTQEKVNNLFTVYSLSGDENDFSAISNELLISLEI